MIFFELFIEGNFYFCASYKSLWCFSNFLACHCSDSIWRNASRCRFTCCHPHRQQRRSSVRVVNMNALCARVRLCKVFYHISIGRCDRAFLNHAIAWIFKKIFILISVCFSWETATRLISADIEKTMQATCSFAADPTDSLRTPLYATILFHRRKPKCTCSERVPVHTAHIGQWL